MASDQTPIEKAIEALKDAVDRIDNMVCAIDSGIHESELHDTAGDINDALAAIAAHVEAQRTPVSYAISKDYEALYDHLRNGGEALGRGYYKGTKVCHGFDADNSFVKAGNKAKLIDQCARLNLEWLAPAQPLSAQQVFDVVEEFIKQEAERVGTDQPTGLEYPVGHRHWNNMIADLRERLNKLLKTNERE